MHSMATTLSESGSIHVGEPGRRCSARSGHEAQDLAMRAAISSLIALRTLAVARAFAPTAARAARAPSHGAAADRIELDGHTFERVRVAVTDELALDVFEAGAAAQDALVELSLIHI